MKDIHDTKENNIPNDCYTFADYYGDGLERLRTLIDENGYALVADLYTYGMPISLLPYSNLGWKFIPQNFRRYDKEFGCSIVTLPIPYPIEN